MKKFLLDETKNPHSSTDNLSDNIRLKSLIKKGTAITLLSTTLDKRWVDMNAFRRRIVLDIKNKFKIYFNCIEDAQYWRHPSYLINNEKISLIKNPDDSYNLIISLGKLTSVYKLEN